MERMFSSLSCLRPRYRSITKRAVHAVFGLVHAEDGEPSADAASTDEPDVPSDEDGDDDVD